jgi:hypothetical protein
MKVWMKVNFLQGFYLDDLPGLAKLNELYGDAEGFADSSSGYFIAYEQRVCEEGR